MLKRTLSDWMEVTFPSKINFFILLICKPSVKITRGFPETGLKTLCCEMLIRVKIWAIN